MDEQRIKDRVKARQIAEDILEIVDWSSMSRHMRDAFIEAIDDREQPSPVEIERDASGNEVMPFGLYSGMQIKEVPLGYLRWLHDEQRKTNLLIRAFLRRKDIWDLEL